MKTNPRTQTVKVLSVRQPWASLIVLGFKDVENRTWGTSYRGRMYIHASRKFDHDAMDFLIENKVDIFGEYADEMLEMLPRHPRGALIGRVTLKEIRTFDEEKLDELSPWHFEDNLGWYLEDAEIFEDPIPMNGKLGLFNLALDMNALKIMEDEDEGAG